MKRIDDILGTSGQLAPPQGLQLPPLTPAAWEQAVGARVAARTEPYRLERGVLFVRVASAAWANELAMLTEPIIDHLRAQRLDVRAVRFTVGKVVRPPRTRRDPVPHTTAPLRDLPPDIEQRVKAIDEPELREAIAQAARQSLARHQAKPQPPTEPERGDAATKRRPRPAVHHSSPDRARESPTPGPISPSPPPISGTRLSPGDEGD